MNEDSLVTKATFEDCLASQERLRGIIFRLGSENRCLDESEQGEFFRELAHATYGLGRDKPFKLFIEKDIYSLPGVEYAARWIAMRPSNRVRIPNEIGSDMSSCVDISVLWFRLLDCLFGVFPIALDRSSAMSKEKDSTSGGLAYDFDPNE